MTRSLCVLLLGLTLTGTAACRSAPVREGEGVVQFIDIRNESGEPLLVTARVGASPEQRLGFFEQGGFRRVTVSTGAASTGDIFLRARNPDTGREAVTTLQVTPGETLSWSIRF